MRKGTQARKIASGDLATVQALLASLLEQGASARQAPSVTAPAPYIGVKYIGGIPPQPQSIRVTSWREIPKSRDGRRRFVADTIERR